MKKAMLFLMAGSYFTAGIIHFLHPEVYLKIMPPYLPWHKELVLISGIIEILLGILLLIPKTRIVAAWLIIDLLLAVFPANWQMAQNYYQEQNSRLWIAIVRLPLQILLIYWAWLYTRKRKDKHLMKSKKVQS